MYTKDTLWIATNTKGINGFVPSENSFFSLNLNEENTDLNAAYRCIELDKNYLLSSARNHFVIFNRKEKTHQIIKLKTLEKENSVNGAIKINENDVSLATNNGILNFNLKNQSLTADLQYPTKNFNQLIGLHNFQIFGNYDGITIYDVDLKTSKHIVLNEKVKVLLSVN